MNTLKGAVVYKPLRTKHSKAISMMTIAELQPSLGSGPSCECKNIKSTFEVQIYSDMSGKFITP